MSCVEIHRSSSSSLSAAAVAADEKPQQTEAVRKTQSRIQSQSAARPAAFRTSTSSSSSSSCVTSRQCRNGGTCFASKCICRPGYQGSTCAQRQYLLSLCPRDVVAGGGVRRAGQLLLRLPSKFLVCRKFSSCRQASREGGVAS